MTRITYHRTEDDAATVVGRSRTLLVAYDGSRYLVMRPHAVRPGESLTEAAHEDYTTAIRVACRLADLH